MDQIENLTAVDIGLVLIPVALLVVASRILRLGQERRIAWATVRATVQLVAAGWIVGWVFGHRSWYWVVGLLVVMTLVAADTVARRSPVRSRWWQSTAALGLLLGAVTAICLVYFTQVVIGVRGWEPRYLIPLGGILLGNAMTAAAITAERIGSDLARQGGDVEVLLALGASPARAIRPFLRSAVGAALTPTLNAMLIVGVVKFPGIMTGQILGGSPPLQAALYQLLILSAILLADSITAAATGWLLSRRLFTPAWQLDRSAIGAR